MCCVSGQFLRWQAFWQSPWWHVPLYSFVDEMCLLNDIDMCFYLNFMNHRLIPILDFSGIRCLTKLLRCNVSLQFLRWHKSLCNFRDVPLKLWSNNLMKIIPWFASFNPASFASVDTSVDVSVDAYWFCGCWCKEKVSVSLRDWEWYQVVWGAQLNKNKGERSCWSNDNGLGCQLLQGMSWMVPWQQKQV